ncbi:hypothetical protein, partial [Bacteroides mediterraneensis]|uniref:hypothetical protein n=1 Tax=Bacteroides mediterraneensis TaxID=1841856 RepID=UPI0026F31860
ERQIVVLNVVGSSPTSHPQKKVLQLQGLFLYPFFSDRHKKALSGLHRLDSASYNTKYKYN